MVVEALKKYGARTVSELSLLLRTERSAVSVELEERVRDGLVQLRRSGNGSVSTRGRLGSLYELTRRGEELT